MIQYPHREICGTIFIGGYAYARSERFGIISRYDKPDQCPAGNINNRLDGIDARLDAVDTRLDGIDARLDTMDVRFDGIDARLDAMDVRFDEIDARFNRVENRLEMIDLKCDTNRKRLDDLSLDVKLAERDIRKDIKNLQDTTETLVVVLQGKGILPDPGNTIQTA